jgi:RNA polymerase sigma-70 factor (ECF subfamily)
VRDPAAWQAWLFGIARNVCLRWQRRTCREMARFTTLPEGDRAADIAVALDEDRLEREELAGLVEKVLSRLPEHARTVLQERYLLERPAAEVAAAHGISEGAVGVRLHRAKAAFRKVVQKDLWSEAAAYGLLAEETTGGWQETSIWCPYCGVHKLLGWFDRRPSAESFRMNCPRCLHPTGRRPIGAVFTCEQHTFDFARVLGDIRMFRPALRRTQAWWGEHFRALVRHGYGPCADCGKPTRVLFAPPASRLDLVRIPGIFVACGCKGRVYCIPASALALTQPEVQSFWQRHPRIRRLPDRIFALEGGHRRAVLSRFESVTERAAIEVVAAATDFRVLHIGY